MVLSRFSAALALIPMVTLGSPVLDLAQASDPYSDWNYLYEDTFENSAGTTITQQWWLNPDTLRQGNTLNFTLLARRNPVSDDGIAAAVFDYVADCETISYTMETATFLDGNYATLNTQTYRTVMKDAETSDRLYTVLANLCGSGG